MKNLLLLSIFIILSLSSSRLLSKKTSQTLCARVRSEPWTFDYLGNDITKFVLDTGDRSETYWIPFPNGTKNKFCKIPQVSVFLTGFSMKNNDNPVIFLDHHDVNTTGFQLTVSTIENVVLNQLRFVYVALDIPNRTA